MHSLYSKSAKIWFLNKILKRDGSGTQLKVLLIINSIPKLDFYWRIQGGLGLSNHMEHFSSQNCLDEIYRFRSQCTHVTVLSMLV